MRLLISRLLMLEVTGNSRHFLKIKHCPLSVMYRLLVVLVISNAIRQQHSTERRPIIYRTKSPNHRPILKHQRDQSSTSESRHIHSQHRPIIIQITPPPTTTSTSSHSNVSTNSNTSASMVYDPKHYSSARQHWDSIIRFHISHEPDYQAFADVLQRYPALKMDIAMDPKLTKNIIFPMVMHYKRTNYHFKGFPNLTLDEEIDKKNRSLLFYNVVTRCEMDHEFVERLYAIKMIDHHDNRTHQELESISFVDIARLSSFGSDGIFILDEDVLMEMLSEPIYHRTKEDHFRFFWKMHHQFKLDRKPARDPVERWVIGIRQWLQLGNAMGTQEFLGPRMELMNTKRGRGRGTGVVPWRGIL